MPPTPPRRPPPAEVVDPRRVLAWLDHLRGAVVRRDEAAVGALLGRREARVAPREVLEEALALARAPAGSMRAPVALLRFAWVVQRLDAAGEPMPGITPAAPGYHTEAPAAQLELAWPRDRRPARLASAAAPRAPGDAAHRYGDAPRSHAGDIVHVEIWSDIACPWCYVGKRRWERALADFPHRDDVVVTWRSFELDPGAPPRHDEPQAALLARKYGTTRAQAEAMNARMTAEAAKEGLAYRLDRVVVGNTFDAHRLIHEAALQGRREEMVERLFAAYLAEGAALGEPEVLARLAAEVGLDADDVRGVLAGDRHAAAVRDDEARARSLGITGVPFFVLDGRLGVSGAQPPEVLLGALTQAWEERQPALQMVGDAERGAGADAACGEDGCAV